MRRLVGVMLMLLMLLVLPVLPVLLVAAPARAAEGDKPDPKGVALVEQMFAAAAKAGGEQALVPLLHKTLLDDSGTKLAPLVKEYKFPRLVERLGWYVRPIEVTGAEVTADGALGYGKDEEKGRLERYWIKRSQKHGGRGAPIDVFFPKDGGPPKISDFGSL